jgi:hypothetical protein
MRLEPPYSPNDQNLGWVAAYNELLRQVLEVFLSPADMQQLRAKHTPNEYANFRLLSWVLNELTVPR